MNSITGNILAEIAAERDRQDKQYGGAEHDDTHGREYWSALRERFEHRTLTSMAYMNPSIQRKALVSIAAIAIAQIESLDRSLNK